MQAAKSDRPGCGVREREREYDRKKNEKKPWKQFRKEESWRMASYPVNDCKSEKWDFFFFLSYFCVSLQRKAPSTAQDCSCLYQMSAGNLRCLDRPVGQPSESIQAKKKKNTPQVIQPLIGSSGLCWPTYITASPLNKGIASREKWQIRLLLTVLPLCLNAIFIRSKHRAKPRRVGAKQTGSLQETGIVYSVALH